MRIIGMSCKEGMVYLGFDLNLESKGQPDGSWVTEAHLNSCRGNTVWHGLGQIAFPRTG